MKTQQELERGFSQICDHLHLRRDDERRFYMGILIALLWGMGRYSTWVDCEIAAEELWQYSRAMRANLLACLPR